MNELPVEKRTNRITVHRHIAAECELFLNALTIALNRLLKGNTPKLQPRPIRLPSVVFLEADCHLLLFPFFLSHQSIQREHIH